MGMETEDKGGMCANESIEQKVKVELERFASAK